MKVLKCNTKRMLLFTS